MNDRLKNAVDLVFASADFGDAFLASEAIETLYTLAEDWALQAKALSDEDGDFMEIAKLMYKIQQLLNASPLDHFLLALSNDELMPIRAAAKGNLAERLGTFGDHEVALMGSANLVAMFSAEELMAEVGSDPDFQKGAKDWEAAGVTEFPYDYKS